MKPNSVSITSCLLLLLVKPFSFSANAFILPNPPGHFLRTPADTNPPSTQIHFDRKIPAFCGCQRLASKSTSDEEPESSGSSWIDGGRVSVRVEKNLPSASDSVEARDAWLEQHWEKGGGLPIYAKQTHSAPILNDSLENGLGGWVQRRIIFPIMMEEELILKESTEDEESSRVEYTVTKPGWALQSDLVADSHTGTVTFAPLENGAGCTMTWEVEFDAVRWRGLYQAVTEFTIGTAARTVAESLKTPRLLTLKARLDGTADPVEARRDWLEFFWARGGGLPLPPPIPYGNVLKEGGGSARKSILRVPPLLVDTILSTSSTRDSAGATYQIKEPGWTTLPFLIHTHIGRVRFAKSDEEGRVDITWEIEVRPFPIAAPLVEKLLEMTASTIIRNLQVHFAEPGERIEIKPPRGNADLVGGMESFGSVPKDFWLGGVLDAHLRDGRSPVEQTISMVQPWTWGRTGSGDEGDIVTFGWSDANNFPSEIEYLTKVTKYSVSEHERRQVV